MSDRKDASLTDAEVICEWMEPRPELPLIYSHLMLSPKHWWALGAIAGGGMRWFPLYMGYPIGLDALHEVESRLTDEQWGRYRLWFANEHAIFPYSAHPFGNLLLHATAAQKIAALTAVLRSEVEK